MQPLLEIKDLQVRFATEKGLVRAVEGVNLKLHESEILGIVGESGSGKSVTALSILNLLARSAQVNGEILFRGNNIINKSEKEMEKIRGDKISMIFQEPMTSLNPVYTIGEQIKEVYRYHNKYENKADLNKKSLEMLEMVKIPEAKKRFNEYPHQMSGGMRQRVMIAMSLACDPDVLIADEPTTALDVTVQGQILALIKELQREFNTAVMMITHDLGVVAQVTDQVAVMYAGQVVESNNTWELFKNPKHPYTHGLMGTIPRLDEHQEKLAEIKGVVPDMKRELPGCHFYPRCHKAMDKCMITKPELIQLERPQGQSENSIEESDKGSWVRCLLYQDNPPKDKDNRGESVCQNPS